MTYYKSWGSSENTDHRHALKKVTCKGCHGLNLPKRGLLKEECLRCHDSYQKIVKKSAIHINAMNPHFGDGKELGCDSCHKAHEKSIPICKDCH